MVLGLTHLCSCTSKMARQTCVMLKAQGGASKKIDNPVDIYIYIYICRGVRGALALVARTLFLGGDIFDTRSNISCSTNATGSMVLTHAFASGCEGGTLPVMQPMSFCEKMSYEGGNDTRTCKQ